MINCADGLVENLDRRNAYAVWRYSYPSFFRTSSGWRSAHAQGQAIQLLLRAYETTRKNNYFDSTVPAINAFYLDVNEDGLTQKLSESEWWYHKFADVNCELPFVLNGMIFALLGLHDAHLRTGSLNALELFNKGQAAVIRTLPLFDQGEWSFYLSKSKPATRHYHKVHCQQIRALLAISPSPVLQEVYDRWVRADTVGATGGTW